jgi:hypothetical protein
MKLNTPSSQSTQLPHGVSLSDELDLEGFDDVAPAIDDGSPPPLRDVAGAPGGGRLSLGSVLSTPSVASQGGTGPSEGSYKLTLVTAESGSKMCRTEVGKDKDKFCTFAAEECEYKTHATNPEKVEIVADTFIVEHASRHQGHKQPMLHKSQLFDSDQCAMVENMRGDKLTLEAFINARSPRTQVKKVKDEAMPDFDDAALEKLDQATAALFQTGMTSPNAKAVGIPPAVAPKADQPPRGVERMAIGPAGGRSKSPDESALSAQVESLALELAKTKEALGTLGQDHKVTQGRLDKLSALGNTVSATVGRRPKDYDHKEYGADLWTAAKKFAEIGAGMEKDFGVAQEDFEAIKAVAAEAKAGSEAVNGKLHQLATTVNQTISFVKSQEQRLRKQDQTIAQQELTIQDLVARVMNLEGGQTAPPAVAAPTFRSSRLGAGAAQADIAKLNAQVAMFDVRLSGFDGRLGGVDGRVSQLELVGVQGMGCPPEVLSKLADLEQAQQLFKVQMEGSATFVCNGKVYNGEHDVLKHMEAELPDFDVATLVDVFSCYCNMDQRLSGAADWAKKHADSSKAGYSTQQTKVLWSAQVDCPPCVTAKNKTEEVPEDEGFGKMFPSYAAFAGTGTASEAAVDVVKKRVKEMKTAHETLVCHKYPVGSESRNVCLRMNDLSKEHSTALLEWCRKEHNVLVDKCDHPTKIAWQYVGRSIRRMFKEIAVPRSKVAELTDIALPTTKAAWIWAFMKAHSLMDQIVENDFDAHPVFTLSMHSFLMTNRVDKSAFKEAAEKLTKCVKKVDGLENDIKPIKSSVADHSKQISNLQKSKKDKQ